MHGAESGSLTKAEVRSALESFFAVGQQGGKTVSRFDELMQVLHHLPHMSASKHADGDGESNEEGRNREKITSTCQSYLFMLHASASLSHRCSFLRGLPLVQAYSIAFISINLQCKRKSHFISTSLE